LQRTDAFSALEVSRRCATLDFEVALQYYLYESTYSISWKQNCFSRQ